MRRPLKYGLIGDGTSDQALLPILRWSLRRLLPDTELMGIGFAARVSQPVEEFVGRFCRQYRPDITFVHRDAERQPRGTRRLEIPTSEGVVGVVPVRMTEAWLLIDELAIRRAASNPNGRIPIVLPRSADLEHLPDPKATLRELLVRASGLSGRKLQRLDRGAAVRRVADCISDFSQLDRLSAFVAFTNELRAAISTTPFARI